MSDAPNATGSERTAAGDPLKAENELQTCLSEVEESAHVKYAEGVRTKLADLARPKFVEQEPRWAEHGEEVRRASRFVGRFAHLFAEFDGSDELREADLLRAVAIMKGVCHARLQRRSQHTSVGIFYAWCPDSVPDGDQRRS
jgi:hypothetical protein